MPPQARRFGLRQKIVFNGLLRGARVVVNDLGTNVSGFGKDSGIAEEVADLIRSRGGEAIAMTVMFPPLKAAVT